MFFLVQKNCESNSTCPEGLTWGLDQNCPGSAEQCWAECQEHLSGGSWYAVEWNQAATVPSVSGCGWWTEQWRHTPDAWMSAECPGLPLWVWTGFHRQGRSLQSLRHSRHRWGRRAGQGHVSAQLRSPELLLSPPDQQENVQCFRKPRVCSHLLSVLTFTNPTFSAFKYAYLLLVQTAMARSSPLLKPWCLCGQAWGHCGTL